MNKLLIAILIAGIATLGAGMMNAGFSNGSMMNSGFGSMMDNGIQNSGFNLLSGDTQRDNIFNGSMMNNNSYDDCNSMMNEYFG